MTWSFVERAQFRIRDMRGHLRREKDWSSKRSSWMYTPFGLRPWLLEFVPLFGVVSLLHIAATIGIEIQRFINSLLLGRASPQLLFDLIDIMFQEVLGWLCKGINDLAYGCVRVRAHYLFLSHPSLLNQAHVASDGLFCEYFAQSGERQGLRVAIHSM